MKFSIFIVSVLIASIVEATSNNTSSEKDEGTVEDVIREFEERAKKTKQAIAESTQEVIDLARDPIENSLNKTEEAVKDILRDGEEIVIRYNEIKIKFEKDLVECKAKNVKKFNSLDNLLMLSKQLENLTEEIKKCPTKDISGMGCTLSKLMRGEEFIEEIENLIQKGRKDSEKRIPSLTQAIGDCYRDAMERAKKEMETFLTDIKRSDHKDEL